MSPATSAIPIADSLSDADRAYDAGDYAKAEMLLMSLAKQGDASAGNLYLAAVEKYGDEEFAKEALTRLIGLIQP